MSWWFCDTGRNAWRRSCEEGGERRKIGEDGGRREKRLEGQGVRTIKGDGEEGGVEETLGGAWV